MLDKDRITRAALELINLKGYSGLTMTALAKLLHVAPSALYNHVTAKRDVLVLLQEHLTAKVDVSKFGVAAWEEAVRTWAWSYRDVFAKHTPLIPVIAVLPVTDAPQTLAMYEKVSETLLHAGFPAERIISAIVALESFIFGSAYDATAPSDIFEPGTLADTNPHFTAVNSSTHNHSPGRADTAFTLGLEALISAFRSWQSTSGHRAPDEIVP